MHSLLIGFAGVSLFSAKAAPEFSVQVQSKRNTPFGGVTSSVSTGTTKLYLLYRICGGADTLFRFVDAEFETLEDEALST